MKKTARLNIILYSIVTLFASLVVFCRFPYQPEPFVLPEQPYKFPQLSYIQDFFGTQMVKFTYTLSGNGAASVYYIDFSADDSVHTKLKKPGGKEDFDACSPLISPDGFFVAYGIKNSNSNMAYGAYIQRLDPGALPVEIDENGNGAEPHWWVDTSGIPHQTYVIYSDLLEVPAELSTGLGHTYRRKVSLDNNGGLQGASEIIAPYPMNGGMSKDGRYLCTGYTKAAFYDVPSQSLIRINGAVQVCNPSICPDIAHPDRMMFLNISGKQSLTNPFMLNGDFPSDSSLGQHKFIFIVDINNTVIDYVPITIMGNSYHAWQCPEWSTNPSFSAAIALADDNAATGDGVVIKGVGDRAAAKTTLIFTIGSGKLNAESTPSVWVGNQ